MVKLTCRQVIEELNSYLDDEAAAELRSSIESHLEHCPRCWIVFDTTKKMLELICESEPLEVPLDVSARLYQRLTGIFSGRVQSQKE